MKCSVLAGLLAGVASAASAGTLTIGFEGGPQKLTDTTEGAPEITFVEPYAEAFVFDVAGLAGPYFDFGAELDYATRPANFSGEISYNPFGAMLLSRPDGHLGGYYEGAYAISVRPGFVSVEGRLADGDDVTFLTSSSVLEDHNQGLFYYESTGFWTASYAPGDDGDGTAFDVPGEVSAVPLPAAGGLLLAALAGVGSLRRRRGPASVA